MAVVHTRDADEWRDIASRSFVPLSFPRTAADFSATMDHRQLGVALSLSRISTNALVIDRTDRLAHGADSDDVHISLQVSARGSVLQRGRATPVGPGTLTLCETNQPFVLRYTEPNQQHIVLQSDRSLLGVPDRLIADLAGRQIGQQDPAASAYVSYVSALLADDRGLAGPASDVAPVILALVRAMLRSEGGIGAQGAGLSEALLPVVLEFIRMNLTSPDLSPEMIARAHFISRRHLYSLFETMDEAPADYIRTERLRRAAAALSDELSRHRRIADIAWGLGFSDSTTFTRAFARQFGTTPRDFRAAQLARRP